MLDDDELVECYLNHPDINNQLVLPIDYNVIKQHQDADVALQQLLQNKPNHFIPEGFPKSNPTINLICYSKTLQNDNWRICIPTPLIDQTVQWFHVSLCHAGVTRTRNTILQHMTHPDLLNHCENIIRNCPTCQQHKTRHRQYGYLPPRQVNANPWAEINVDLIGPWNLVLQNKVELEFRALTIIDPVTNFVEIIRIHNKTAKHVGLQLENAWLSRYPCPTRCVYDQGGEFTGSEFKAVLTRHGIKNVPLTAKNPQSNAICKRMHHTVADAL
jgi:hypothetical protein